MEQSVFISVIVPVYNTEKYLRECLDSIARQTFRMFEVIMVDDGSKDSCSKICDEYAEAYSNFRVIHKVNEGLILARRTGLLDAQGEYIVFVDSDDWINEHHLEKLATIIHDYKPDVIMEDFLSAYDSEVCIAYHSPINNGLYDADQIKSHIYPRMLSEGRFYHFGITPSLWCKCFTKRILVNSILTIPSNMSFGEDVACTISIMCNARSLCVTHDCEYYYRIHEESMVHSYNPRLEEGVLVLLDHLWNTEKAYKWNGGDQINQYALMLIEAVLENRIIGSNEKRSMKMENVKAFMQKHQIRQAIEYSIEYRKADIEHRMLWRALAGNRYLMVYTYLQGREFARQAARAVKRVIKMAITGGRTK